MTYKIGQKLLCINAINAFQKDRIYIIQDIDIDRKVYYYISSVFGIWTAKFLDKHFIKVKEGHPLTKIFK
jgi:hypothetical protein